jgi:hypothetical protein
MAWIKGREMPQYGTSCNEERNPELQTQDSREERYSTLSQIHILHIQNNIN